MKHMVNGSVCTQLTVLHIADGWRQDITEVACVHGFRWYEGAVGPLQLRTAVHPCQQCGQPIELIAGAARIRVHPGCSMRHCLYCKQRLVRPEGGRKYCGDLCKQAAHDAAAASAGPKKCRGCNAVRPIAAFPKHIKNRDGYSHLCRVCLREYDRERKRGLRPAEEALS